MAGIRLGLTDREAVADAYDDLMETVTANMPDACIDGVVVQEMIPGGVEMILGMVLDPQFGALIMVGTGSTLTELIEDRAIAFAPVSHAAASAMIDELRVAKLLDGWRGGVRLDRCALANALVSLSDFAARTDGQIVAIDLNPVMVLPEGHGVRIVDALIVPNN